MWLHILILVGFNEPDSFPLMQLRKHVGAAEWEWHRRKSEDLPGVETFVTQKMLELEEYDERRAPRRALNADGVSSESRLWKQDTTNTGVL